MILYQPPIHGQRIKNGNNIKRNSSFLKVLPHMFLKSGISFSPDGIDCPWFYGGKSDFKLFPSNIKKHYINYSGKAASENLLFNTTCKIPSIMEP